MDNEHYFQSLTLELNSLKDRVRNFIGDHHWLTDGEWKESVLRTVLRRHLPQSIGVGKGFVLRPNGEPSSQIDILLYDASKPVLYRENELLIVSPDAALGTIEVKTNVRKGEMERAFSKLADVVEIVWNTYSLHRFFGLFSFEKDDSEDFNPLVPLRDAVAGNPKRTINCVCLGDSYFIRFWEFDPTQERRRSVDRWHSYNLQSKAPAYFVYNVIEHLCPNSVGPYNDLWFPDSGKEPFKIDQIERKFPEQNNRQ